MFKLSDKELIKRAKKRDRRACRSLLHQYTPMVYGYFRQLGLNVEVTEDLSQETFLRFWRSIHNFQGRSALRYWLLRICSRVAAAHFEKKSPPSQQSDIDQIDNAQDELTPGQLLLLKERVTRLHEQLITLSFQHREVLILHYLQELTLTEIATMLDIPLGTVKSRCFHAIRQLKGRLLTEE